MRATSQFSKVKNQVYSQDDSQGKSVVYSKNDIDIVESKANKLNPEDQRRSQVTMTNAINARERAFRENQVKINSSELLQNT